MSLKVKSVLEVVDSISTRVGKLASFLILVLIGTVLYEVFARYVFAAPTVWSFKLTTFLWGGAFLLGGAWVLSQNRHVSIDILTLRLPPRARAIVSLVTYLFLFLPFAGILLWKGIDQAAWSWSNWEREYVSPWEAPLYPIKTVIPIAVSLLLAQGIAKCTRDLFSAIKGKKL